MTVKNTAHVEDYYTDLIQRLRLERDHVRRTALHRWAAEAADQAALAATYHRSHPADIARWRHLAQRHRRHEATANPQPPRPKPPTPKPPPRPRTGS